MGSLAVWSSVVLWISFGLQVTLLALLVRRRLASELRVFAGLLLFYATRSAVLYGSARLLPHGGYADLYNTLSLADLLLQIALAGELVLMSVRSVVQRLLVALSAPALAAGLTALLVGMLPARSSVPADRGTIFTGVLFVILSVVAARVRLGGWARAVATGLAVAGVAGMLSECGKSYAAFHRNGVAYVAWSYGNAACYLGVLGYWIVASLRQRRREPVVREAEAGYARGSIGVDRLEA